MESPGELTAQKTDWNKSRKKLGMIPHVKYRAKPGHHIGDSVRVGASLDLNVDYIQALLGPREYEKLVGETYRDIRKGVWDEVSK